MARRDDFMNRDARDPAFEVMNNSFEVRKNKHTYFIYVFLISENRNTFSRLKNISFSYASFKIIFAMHQLHAHICRRALQDKKMNVGLVLPSCTLGC